MGDSKFKPGDEVLVKGKVLASSADVHGHEWVQVEIDGWNMTFDVEAELVQPAPLDVDQAFGGMPAGTVEVTRERWLELPKERRALISTTVTHNGVGGESRRYFEVVGRG